MIHCIYSNHTNKIIKPNSSEKNTSFYLSTFKTIVKIRLKYKYNFIRLHIVCNYGFLVSKCVGLTDIKYKIEDVLMLHLIYNIPNKILQYILVIILSYG